MSIVLIGFMCSGKSAVGRCLAERLRLPFVDTDALVEQQAQLSIAEIFTRYGEPHFRVLEHQAVNSIYAANTDLVIATGGGIVENPLNMALLRQMGMVVWLEVGLDTVVTRATVARSQRPLLNKGKCFLDRLYMHRRQLYQRYADCVVCGENHISQVAGEVARSVSYPS